MNKHVINSTARIPPYSPELFPIKHTWTWLSGEIVKVEVVDEHDLINQAEAIWNDPTLMMCKNYITHLNTVTRTIVDANGSSNCT